MTSGISDRRSEFAPPPPVRPPREGNPAWAWPGECSPTWCCTATGVCKAEEAAAASAAAASAAEGRADAVIPQE